MAGRTGAVLTDDAQGVGVIDHDAGVVLLAQRDDLGKLRDVAFHRIDAVDNYELVGSARYCPELLLEPLHVIVWELAHLAETQAAAIDDASVVKRIQESESSAETEAAHHSEVDLEAGAVRDGLFLAHETGELFLQLLVDVEGTVEETAAGAA